MKIKAIKNTTALIKGYTYEVVRMYNANPNGHGRVWVKEMEGSLNVCHFTDMSGNPLPNTNYGDVAYESVKFNDIERGDILVCKSKSHKSLVYGKMYRVEDLIVEKRNYNYAVNKIRLEGVKKTFMYNSWNWRKLSKDEVRDLSLLDLLENKEPDIVKEVVVDKFDAMENTEVELFRAVAQSMVDKKRHHLGLIDWYCRIPLGVKMNAKPEHFERILDMPLREIIRMVDESK